MGGIQRGDVVSAVDVTEEQQLQHMGEKDGHTAAPDQTARFVQVLIRYLCFIYIEGNYGSFVEVE